MNTNTESPKEVLREVDRGTSESTPFVMLGGVTLVVGIAVVAVVAIVVAAIFIIG
jgi:hypothetical protein